jgi:hypothetical protein
MLQLKKKTSFRGGSTKKAKPLTTLKQSPPTNENQFIDCPMCSMSVRSHTRRFLRAHVSQYHSNEPLFRCLSANCGDKLYHSYSNGNCDIRKHINTEHGGDMSLIEDNRAVAYRHITEMTNQIFGPLHVDGEQQQQTNEVKKENDDEESEPIIVEKEDDEIMDVHEEKIDDE